MNWILLPIAFLYQGLLCLRHKLFDWHILPSKRFDTPVICIGNISLGGTGKTPHTEYLIRLLKDEYSVATLSRGYGRKTKGFRIAAPTSTADDIGDELIQYRKKFPDIMVAADENRVEGVEKLLQSQNPPQVILLDDAMQHRSIQPGLTLLLTEHTHLYVDDYLVPAGTLRDVRSAARRADLVIITKTPIDIDEKEKTDILKRLKLKPHQKVFFSHIQYETLKAMNPVAESTDATQSEAALLFCGIAHPAHLIHELKEKYPILDVMTFSDHHPFNQDDVKHLLERYDQLSTTKKIVITTEKDLARLTNSPYLCKFESVPLFTAPIHIKIDEEEKFNKEILSYVRENTQHR